MFTAPRFALLFALLVCAHSLASSDNSKVSFSSGPHKVALVELFTSEGCSSCPPADRWLSQLKADPGLWNDFTPIAFHVDYWDYIGWNDRFAQSQFGDRQRRYAFEGGARVVYTPGFFVNGSEWIGWRKATTVSSANDEVGNLSISVSDKDVLVRFDAQNKDSGDLIVHIAVLGMNLETRVAAGENVGKALHHDFVALGVVSVPLNKTAAGYEAVTRLPAISLRSREQAIVAWVSDNKWQAPVQSVGGILVAASQDRTR